MTAFHMTKQEFDKVMPSTRVDAFIKKPIGMTKLLDHLGALSCDNCKKGNDNWSISSSSISSFFTSAGTTAIALILLSLQDSIAMFV